MVIETKVLIGWFKLQLEMWLVDLNYNFECDWLIELSDNKLSDNKLSDNKLSDNDEGLTLETSALYSLRWSIYIFNLVDITKLPCPITTWPVN